jgi:hypothetical protein
MAAMQGTSCHCCAQQLACSRSTLYNRHMTKKPAQPKWWRTTLIRRRGEFLGLAQAKNRAAAEAAAIERFGLTAE